MKIAMLVLSALVASAAPAFAQEQEPVPGPEFEPRYDELATWLREYEAWEKWFEKWGNRVARNFNDQLIWERKKRPEPPVWLEAECQGYFGVDGQLASACYILRHWEDQPLLILQRRRSSLATSGGKVGDKDVKSSFFQRVHLTGLWLHARYPASPVYGIVGMQIGVFETGRFTLPAIGVMLVMIPDGEGGHDWKPATTVGFGFRICDFVPPLIKRQASLHFNIARTTLHGVQDDRMLPGTLNFNLFGLSVSAKRHR
jgi:hypothetical protein